MGDREANLASALEELGRREGIVVVEASRMRETEPVGGPEGQGMYLNGAVALDTTLTPRELLEACLEIEHSLGRARGLDDARWGPRTIDIDILLYGDRIIREPDLGIPHPRMSERRFVLAPLAEIAPDARHPVSMKTAGELLDEMGRAARNPGRN